MIRGQTGLSLVWTQTKCGRSVNVAACHYSVIIRHRHNYHHAGPVWAPVSMSQKASPSFFFTVSFAPSLEKAAEMP